MERIMSKNEYVSVMSTVAAMQPNEAQCEVLAEYMRTHAHDKHNLTGWWLGVNDTIPDDMDRVIHNEGELYDAIIRYADREEVDFGNDVKIADTMNYIKTSCEKMIADIDKVLL